MESINEKEIDEVKQEKHTFESKKIMSLNKFFMKNVMWGLNKRDVYPILNLFYH
jgi:uncharacterized protein YcgI (DUF1989 family)